VLPFSCSNLIARFACVINDAFAKLLIVGDLMPTMSKMFMVVLMENVLSNTVGVPITMFALCAMYLIVLSSVQCVAISYATLVHRGALNIGMLIL
jgi:hypothetical protein